jgi:hypothetical protein
VDVRGAQARIPIGGTGGAICIAAAGGRANSFVAPEV